MVEKLIDYFLKFQVLTDEEKNMIRQGTDIQAVKKGTILLNEGEKPNDNYFVLNGCIRQYYLMDGEEKTSNFFTEDEWILPFTSVEQNGVSKYYLESLEDSYLVVANDKKGNNFLEEYPKFRKTSQLILEKEIVRQQNEIAKYINQTPEQRYLALQENRPDLILRVPQYQIASYVGVKPESLSRIRKRMTAKLKK